MSAPTTTHTPLVSATAPDCQQPGVRTFSKSTNHWKGGEIAAAPGRCVHRPSTGSETPLTTWLHKYIILYVWMLFLVAIASLWCCSGTNQVLLKVFPEPNLFEGSFFVLKCFPEDEGWRVHRNITDQSALNPQLCGQGWGRQLMSSSCKVGLAVTWDTGLYWCQSKEGAVSNIVGVRVASGKLLVVVPLLPVSEGEDLTLSCLDRDRFNVSAHFYRDDLQLTSDPRSELRLRAVSWSERGWYKCSTGAMESSPALLQVHNCSEGETESKTELPPTNSTSRPDPTHMHLFLRVLCHLLVFCPYCISTVLMISLCQQQKPDDERPRHK